MNVEAYVCEVLAGLDDANAQHGTSIGIEEIEIVPNDFPTSGQVRYCAKSLTSYYIRFIQKGAPSHPVG
jgi:hypothetical protein